MIPGKAPRPQRDNLIELDRLKAVFGMVLINDIKPYHVREYLDRRGEQAKARANREKALLSHVFNKAREWGYADDSNGARWNPVPQDFSFAGPRFVKDRP
ncbi:MAG: hypothetical protein EPO01_08665 [Aquabacterium sp.]|nr:MAG: hypothetical protein EPO01_08665 [Aquabacterium sp.]